MTTPSIPAGNRHASFEAAPIDLVPIEQVKVMAYRVPTEAPESDGTLEWSATVLVVVEIDAGGKTGLGFTYADTATAQLIRDKFAPMLRGMNALAGRACYQRMQMEIRNSGRSGIAAMAISALDIALWDLKGKLLNCALLTLLGAARPEVAAYASGGFTSYSEDRLREQMQGWAEDGFQMVKMKVGRDSEQDPIRVQIARDAVGDTVKLFVDANGAFSRKQALDMAYVFSDNGVTWFEEPVTSDDLAGLTFLRNQGPAGMDITAGEYGYDPFYFRRLLDAQAVDTLQADLTRCGGITGFMTTAALCEAHNLPLSCHCAPALHTQVACAAAPVVHVEYFHDHMRIEQALFDGVPALNTGMLKPDTGKPGLGIAFKQEDAKDYAL